MSFLNEVKLNNLLKELDLEPTWDKVKRYLLGISIGLSLYPLFITLGGLNVKCLPIDLSIGENPSLENERTELTGPQTQYVNERCSRDGKMAAVTDGSYKMLISGMIILIFSTFWLYRKSIAESLRRFDKARRLMDESNLTIEEKKELCKEILTRRREHAENMEEHRKIREICLLVTVDGPKRLVFNMYVSRVILLLATYIASIAVIAVDLSSIRKVDDTFNCQLKEFMPGTSTNGTSMDLFICTVNQAKAIRISLILFLISIVLQCVAIFVSIWAYVDSGLQKFDKIRRSLKLLLVLSDYSKKCKQLEELIKYLHSQEYKEAVLERATDIIEKQDFQLMQIVGKIFKGELIKHLLESFITDARSSADNFPSKWYIEVMKAAKYQGDDPCAYKLAQKLIRAKKWSLLVELLENSKLKKFHVTGRTKMWNRLVELLGNCMLKKFDVAPQTKMSSLRIPLQDLDESATRERRSILYYAFDKSYFSGHNKLAAAKILCKGKFIGKLEIFKKPIDSEPLPPIGLENFLREKSYNNEEIEEIIMSLHIKREPDDYASDDDEPDGDEPDDDEPDEGDNLV